MDTEPYKIKSVKVPIMIARILTLVFAVLTIIYSVAAFKKPAFHPKLMFLGALTQGGLSMFMLFSGLDYFFYRKQKTQGIIFWIVSGLNLFVMIFGIYVAWYKKYF